MGRRRRHNPDLFEVECILEGRITESGDSEYLVRWKNHNSDKDCWVKAIDVSANRLVAEFHRTANMKIPAFVIKPCSNPCCNIGKPSNGVITTIQELADFIKVGSCKNIVVLSGAGISTGAGIPDFRSTINGLHDLIKAKYEHITDPNEVFTVQFYAKHTSTFLEIMRPLLTAEDQRPTVAHAFIKMLSNKGILLRNYTQNIDGLEVRAGITKPKLIECHGSFSAFHCIACQKDYTRSWFSENFTQGSLPRCKCEGLVRPNIVFYNEKLPEEFEKFVETDLPKCDLLLVLGTSLTVQPISSLIFKTRGQCPKVFFNRSEPPEDIRRINWTIFKGDIEDRLRELIDALGWRDDYSDLVYTLSNRSSLETSSTLSSLLSEWYGKELSSGEVVSVTRLRRKISEIEAGLSHQDSANILEDLTGIHELIPSQSLDTSVADISMTNQIDEIFISKQAFDEVELELNQKSDTDTNAVTVANECTNSNIIAPWKDPSWACYSNSERVTSNIEISPGFDKIYEDWYLSPLEPGSAQLEDDSNIYAMVRSVGLSSNYRQANLATNTEHLLNPFDSVEAGGSGVFNSILEASCSSDEYLTRGISESSPKQGPSQDNITASELFAQYPAFNSGAGSGSPESQEIELVDLSFATEQTQVGFVHDHHYFRIPLEEETLIGLNSHCGSTSQMQKENIKPQEMFLSEADECANMTFDNENLAENSDQTIQQPNIGSLVAECAPKIPLTSVDHHMDWIGSTHTISRAVTPASTEFDTMLESRLQSKVCINESLYDHGCCDGAEVTKQNRTDHQNTYPTQLGYTEFSTNKEFYKANIHAMTKLCAPYICGICKDMGKPLKNPMSRKSFFAHMNTFHVPSRGKRCQLCRQNFGDMFRLRRHVEWFKKANKSCLTSMILDN